MNRLTLHILHHEITTDTSRKNDVFSMNRLALENGARFVLNPELSLTGYSFRNREEALAKSHTVNDAAVQCYADLARTHQAWVGVGFVERSPDSGLLYNSYVVFREDGEQACLYRKIQTELRWATPGNPNQQTTFSTPWGCMGLLICADSYQGLLARKTVLEGARLLLIPANWPRASLDPRQLWQARARENGVFVAVCNRTGKEPNIDFSSSESCVFSPEGDTVFVGSSENSRLFTADIALTPNGRLPEQARVKRLSSRTPSVYHAMSYDRKYYDGLGSFLGIPEPEAVRLAALPTCSASQGVRCLLPEDGEGMALTLLPPQSKEQNFSRMAKELPAGCHVAFALAEPNGKETHEDMLILSRKEEQRVSLVRNGQLRCVVAGSLMVCPARLQEALHPEFSFAASKLGADALLLSEAQCPLEELPVLRARTTEQTAVVVAADTAAVFLPSQGHGIWPVASSATDDCTLSVEVQSSLRRKRFQDRIDFEAFWRPWV